MKRFLRHSFVQAALARALGLYLSIALRTTRWTLDGAAFVAPYTAGEPVIAAFWHERLPLMPALWQLTRRSNPGRNRIHVLVSKHRDGQFIGAVVTRFDINVVLGSSSKGGAAGVRILLGLLRAGDHIGITPDGPRGPRRVAAPGVAQLAALSGAKVLPCAAQISRRWVLGTWDRMVIPLPFARGVVVCGAPIAVAREGWQDAVAGIQTSLTAVTDRADRLCDA
jgi:lysophospholipid acyltransferase (LPLAT)-like uncharacterized protein